MHQRFQSRSEIEVARLAAQHDVLVKAHAGPDMLAQQDKFVRQQGVPADRVAEGDDQDQRRENAANSARVKLRKGKSLCGQTLENNRRDQEPGDHEKNVYSEKATGNLPAENMKRDD